MRENAPFASIAPTGMAEAGNLPASLTRIIGRDETVSRVGRTAGLASFSDHCRSGRDRQNHAGGRGRGRRARLIRGRGLVGGMCIPGRYRSDTERPRRGAGSPALRAEARRCIAWPRWKAGLAPAPAEDDGPPPYALSPGEYTDPFLMPANLVSASAIVNSQPEFPWEGEPLGQASFRSG
jgi:hypothetical protein